MFSGIVEGDGQVVDPGLHDRPDREGRLFKDLEHGLVVGDDIRGKPLDSLLPGYPNEHLEKERGDAPALVIFIDDERHIGQGAVVMADITSLRNDPLRPRFDRPFRRWT